MTSSSVYLEAAELVDSDQHTASCIAVLYAKSNTRGDIARYGDLFRPHHPPILWGQKWGNQIERKACRVIALLLMHAITQYEAKHGR